MATRAAVSGVLPGAGGLLTRAEAGEDGVQDVLAGPPTGQFAESFQGLPQVNGDKLFSQGLPQAAAGGGQGGRRPLQCFSLSGVEPEGS